MQRERWTLARGVAWDRAPGARVRAVLVAFVAAFLMLSVLISCSLVMLRLLQDERRMETSAILSQSPEPSDVHLLVNDDQWRGIDVTVIALEPGTDSPLPVGVESWPPIGESVVSPALSRLAAQHPELRQRYSPVAVIDSQGVPSGDDLMVYSVLAPGVLSGEDQVIRGEDGVWVGEGPVARVSGFGGDGPPALTLRLFPSEAGTAGMIGAGSAISLVLPALLAVMVGLGAGSESRRRRFRILHSLGASRGYLAGVSWREVAFHVWPTMLLIACAWAVFAPMITYLPGVAETVFPGDLSLPWWLLMVGFVGCAALVSALAAGQGWFAARGMAAARPTLEPRTPTIWWLAPAAGSAGCFLLASVTGGERATDLRFAAVALAIIGIPLAVPTTLRAVGEAMTRSMAAPIALAGYTLRWSPRTYARPTVGISAAIVLSLAAAGYIAVAEHREQPRVVTSAPPVVSVQWRGAEPDALDTTHPPGVSTVMPFVTVGEEGGDQQVLIGARCDEIGPALRVPVTCNRADPHTLVKGQEDIRFLLRALGALEDPSTPLELATPASIYAAVDGARGAALVTSTELPVAALADTVSTWTRASLPSSDVRDATSGQPRPSTLVPWVKAAVTTSLLVLVLTALLSYLDRVRAAEASLGPLLRIGASRAQRLQISLALTLVPLLVAGAVSILLGSGLGWLFTTGTVPYPISGLIICGGLMAAALATSSVLALAGVRSTDRTSPPSRILTTETSR